VKAYENPAKRKEMGKRANNFIQKWSWKKVGDMWIDYYDELEKKILPKKYSWEPIENQGVGEDI